MLKKIAEFSKTIKKYSYYPILIGIISIISAWLYKGTFRAYIGIALAVICAVLVIITLLSDKLCGWAGIDPKNR